MSGSSPVVNEADLHAWLDGGLDPERRAQVAAFLAEHPEEAGRLAGYRRLSDALHAAYDPTLAEEIPEQLRTVPRHAGRWRRVAAAAAWLAVGVAIGWSLPDAETTPGSAFSDPGLARPAAVAHAIYTVEVRHPVEVGADQEQHLSRWLSKRLGAELRPPHLAALGYALVGGRLLPADDGPAAQFMYQEAGGRRLTLYVRRAAADSGATAFRYHTENGLSVFYWIDGPFGYALSGTLPHDQLLRIAEVTYRALNP